MMRTPSLLVLAISLSACGADDATTAPCMGSFDVRADGGGSPATVVFSSASQAEARVQVDFGTTVFELCGLESFQSLPPDAGRLFVVPANVARQVLVESALIPFDLIFISNSHNVAWIQPNIQPHSPTRYQPTEGFHFLLAVNGGWAGAHGVVLGTTVSFENFSP